MHDTRYKFWGTPDERAMAVVDVEMMAARHMEHMMGLVAMGMEPYEVANAYVRGWVDEDPHLFDSNQDAMETIERCINRRIREVAVLSRDNVVTALKTRLGRDVKGNLILYSYDGIAWDTASSLSPECYDGAEYVIDCGPNQEIFEYANGDRYTAASTADEWYELADLAMAEL